MIKLTRFARIAITTVLVSAGISSTSFAAEKQGKKPLRGNMQRETTAMIDRYNRPVVIERERSDFKTHATFSAEPQPIEENAMLVFEIAAVGPDGASPRWSCIAVNDVAECLGNGVRVRYGARDEKMVLTITAKPSYTEESRALIAAQSREREAKLARNVVVAAPIADATGNRSAAPSAAHD